ncbi:hypothetical protein AB1N83_009175, partial [Pleurotus pulmonarius]
LPAKQTRRCCLWQRGHLIWKKRRGLSSPSPRRLVLPGASLAFYSGIYA